MMYTKPKIQNTGLSQIITYEVPESNRVSWMNRRPLLLREAPFSKDTHAVEDRVNRAKFSPGSELRLNPGVPMEYKDLIGSGLDLALKLQSTKKANEDKEEEKPKNNYKKALAYGAGAVALGGALAYGSHKINQNAQVGGFAQKYLGSLGRGISDLRYGSKPREFVNQAHEKYYDAYNLTESEGRKIQGESQNTLARVGFIEQNTSNDNVIQAAQNKRIQAKHDARKKSLEEVEKFTPKILEHLRDTQTYEFRKNLQAETFDTYKHPITDPEVAKNYNANTLLRQPNKIVEKLNPRRDERMEKAHTSISSLLSHPDLSGLTDEDKISKVRDIWKKHTGKDFETSFSEFKKHAPDYKSKESGDAFRDLSQDMTTVAQARGLIKAHNYRKLRFEKGLGLKPDQYQISDHPEDYNKSKWYRAGGASYEKQANLYKEAMLNLNLGGFLKGNIMGTLKSNLTKENVITGAIKAAPIVLPAVYSMGEKLMSPPKPKQVTMKLPKQPEAPKLKETEAASTDKIKYSSYTPNNMTKKAGDMTDQYKDRKAQKKNLLKTYAEELLKVEDIKNKRVGEKQSNMVDTAASLVARAFNSKPVQAVNLWSHTKNTAKNLMRPNGDGTHSANFESAGPMIPFGKHLATKINFGNWEDAPGVLKKVPEQIGKLKNMYNTKLSEGTRNTFGKINKGMDTAANIIGTAALPAVIGLQGYSMYKQIQADKEQERQYREHVNQTRQ